MRQAETVAIPTAPSEADVAAALRMLEPLRKVIKPKVYGIENVPPKRALMVGNHKTLGVLDSPLLAAELLERGRIVRSLCDHAHFKIPGWRADDSAPRKVRERTAAAIEEGIELMLAERDADPSRSLARRLLRKDA